MTRANLGVVWLFLCIMAAPFFKLFLERRGVSTAVAHIGGFALLGIGALALAFMRS